MFKINAVLSVLYFAVSISLGSCKSGVAVHEEHEHEIPENVVELREDQIVLANIETGSVELRQINGRIKVNGIITVAPGNLASVCAPMGGFIKSTSLMPGNPVRKGQVLASIENQDFVDLQQNYLEARNRLEFAEAEYNRHTELFKEDVYSEHNVQSVTADYKILKAQVKALGQKLSLIGIDPSKLTEENISSSTVIASPISGYVSNVNISLGKFVNSTDVLFEIINNDDLLLELTLFEKDADKVVKGQNAVFYINNEADEHQAFISQTGKSVNPDKTFKVYASVNDKCRNVMPGMYVNATINTSGKSVAALPAEAVVTFDDKDYIFVFDRTKEEDGKPFSEYKIVGVRKGLQDGNYIEVILPDDFDITNSKVVVKGAYNLLSAKKNAGEMAC